MGRKINGQRMDMSKWVCEEHPWEEMEHEGCGGAGIMEEHKMWMMMIQRRNALQELKEYKAFAEDIIRGLYNRVTELEDTITKKLNGKAAEPKPNVK